MRLGMMQPYFFPYLGYFALIAATDRWVVFDAAQYIRRGWVNRNRVLTTGANGWKYIRIPTADGPRTQRICDMKIAGSHEWREHVVRHLDCYRKRRAPFCDETTQFVADVLRSCRGSLCDVITECLIETCRHVGLKLHYDMYSELQLKEVNVSSPGDWALETSKHFDAEVYINPPGGRQLFDVAAFSAAGVSLQFLTHRLPAYEQRQSEFLSGLSVIDVLMWNGRERTRSLIDDYVIETANEPAVKRAA